MTESLSLDLPRRPVEQDLGAGCRVQQWDAMSPTAATAAMAALERELPWVQEVYYRGRGGRAIPAPRLTSYHADPGCTYTYSGVRYEPAAWTPTLQALREQVGALCGQACNSVLCNLYRDGRDSMGYHSDAEPELGPRRDDIVIASLSLGTRRRFVLKHRRGGQRHAYTLGEGQLLVMRGRTQLDWVHAVPKTARPVGPRLNLTFRVVLTAGR